MPTTTTEPVITTHVDQLVAKLRADTMAFCATRITCTACPLAARCPLDS